MDLEEQAKLLELVKSKILLLEIELGELRLAEAVLELSVDED